MFKRRTWLIAALAAATVLVLVGLGIWGGVLPGRKHRVQVSPEHIASVHQRLLTIDTHVDIPPNWATDEFNAMSNSRTQLDLTRMRSGGLDAAFFIVYVPQGESTVAGNADAVAQAFAKFAAIHRMTERHPNEIELARTADDIERINKSGKLVALIGIENGFALGGRLELLRIYKDLGARYLGLAYNGVNDLADGGMPEKAGDPPPRGGLTEFGKAVIAECNRLGIMVDVAHASKEAVMQAAKISKAPIIDSHTGVAAEQDSPRNLDDATLSAVARTGGVVQIFAWDPYLKPVPKAKEEAVTALRAEFKLGGKRMPLNLSEPEWAAYQGKLAEIDAKWPGADVETLADHIDHAVEVIGLDHVGIASDFGAGVGVKGWMDVVETENVTAELLRRGYTEAELAKIWGGNVLRVMRAVEAAAEK